MFPRKLTNAYEQTLKSSRRNQEFEISDTGYGKDHVKILHVRREGNVHHIKEFEVNTHLKLYSKKDYLNGNYHINYLILLGHLVVMPSKCKCASRRC